MHQKPTPKPERTTPAAAAVRELARLVASQVEPDFAGASAEQLRTVRNAIEHELARLP